MHTLTAVSTPKLRGPVWHAYLDCSLNVKLEGSCAVGSPTALQESIELVDSLQLGVAVQQQCGVVR